MFRFSRSFIVTATFYAYLNFFNEGNDPFQMQVPNCFSYPLVFVDVVENLGMVDDVVMPSNPPVALVKKEELEEAPLDVTLFDTNVFQRSCKEEPSRRVVCI
jgi:hypothetical protein